MNNSLEEMEKTKNKSISYGDYWFMIFCIVLFAVSTIASILLSILNENKISVSIIVAYVITAASASVSLLKFKGELFHPKVYKYEIKKRQEEYWVDNHIEYQESLNKKDKLQGELKAINIDLERLLG